MSGEGTLGGGGVVGGIRVEAFPPSPAPLQHIDLAAYHTNLVVVLR